jgi:hypothetical protein
LDPNASAFGDLTVSGLSSAWTAPTAGLTTRDGAVPALLQRFGGRDAAWLTGELQTAATGERAQP